MNRSFQHQINNARQADQIEHSMSSVAIPAHVQGIQVGETRVQYNLALESEIKTDLAPEVITEAIGVAEVRIADRVPGFQVAVPIQRGMELRLLPLLHAIPGLSPMTAVVGMLEGGKPLVLNLSKAATWNLLVSGPSGCGKSELLRTLMISLALTSRRSRLNIIGVDIGGRELAVLEALPHALTDLATDLMYAKELLYWLVVEAEHRVESGIRQPHIVLVMDDMDWVFYETDDDTSSAVIEIMENGFEVGIHILGALRESMYIENIVQNRIVIAGPLEREIAQGSVSTGRFQFQAGSKAYVADSAWLSARDLGTATRLANATWRATGGSPLSELPDVR